MKDGIESQYGEMPLDTFVSEVSQKMQDPIVEIARVTRTLEENLIKNAKINKINDLNGVMSSLKLLNDYNKAIYRYSLLHKRRIKLEQVRLIEVILGLKDQLKFANKIAVKEIVSDVFVYAEYDLLLQALKELAKEYITNRNLTEESCLYISSRSNDTSVHIHLTFEQKANQRIYEGSASNDSHSLNGIKDESVNRKMNLPLIIAKKMIVDLGGRIEVTEHDDGTKEYTISLNKYVGQGSYEIRRLS